MSDLSFDIKDSQGFYRKLLADYDEFCADTLSSRTALNCAMTAWHLIDWVFYEFYFKKSEQFKKLADFQALLKSDCPSLQIMHDLTNGTKHHTLFQHNSDVQDTVLHEGAYSQEFSSEFDTSMLEIHMKDGTTKYFEEEMESVIEFWAAFLLHNHAIITPEIK